MSYRLVVQFNVFIHTLQLNFIVMMEFATRTLTQLEELCVRKEIVIINDN